MCRMFFQYSLKPSNIKYETLKRFVASCHWHYFRKYNLLGHHNLGWGFAYIPNDNPNALIIKRDINPIYHGDWKSLPKITTKFLLIHARKSYPWKKNNYNIHPININEKFVLTHNGTIKNSSFPQLIDSKFETIKNNTDLDTRKYLCYIIDEINQGSELKKALENIFKTIKIGIAANAFLFNSKQCNIINYHNTRFTARHRTLFISKRKSKIIVATSPFDYTYKEIPNKTLVQILLSNCRIKMNKLEF